MTSLKEIRMSRTKRWLEELSVEMGFGGEITDEVMAEGKSRMEGSERADDPIDLVVRSGELIEAIADREVDKALIDTRFLIRLGLIDEIIDEKHIDGLREEVYPRVKSQVIAFLKAAGPNSRLVRAFQQYNQQDKKEE